MRDGYCPGCFGCHTPCDRPKPLPGDGYIVLVDNKNRITLPEDVKQTRFKLFKQPDGSLILVPMENV